MIRPEATALLQRWAEPALAFAATGVAVSVTGLPGLRWGWVSLALGLPLLLAGSVWLRVAIRRALRPHAEGVGSAWVEERRVLYLGPLGNTQIDLGELDRVDVARAAGGRITLLLSQGGAPPMALPLDAEGTDAVQDALAAETGLSLEALQRAIARATGTRMTTIWRRSGKR